MRALTDFRAGFADGWRRERRRRGLGAQYLRAYRRGMEARDRNDNGGEDVQAGRGRR